MRALEYDRVLEMLAAQTSSSLGRELALALAPSTEFATVSGWLAETAEASASLNSGDRPPFGGVTDVRPAVLRAARGGAIDASELLAVAELVRAGSALRGFLGERQARCPNLAALALAAPTPDGVVKEIRRAITDDAEIADDASPQLWKVRRAIRTLSDRVRERMASYLRGSEHQKLLQEPIITIREGRFVLPVRHESRNAIPGVVHDVSASGATVYVEPLACVPHNNEIRRLAVEEAEEVRRILARLSAVVGAEANAIMLVIETVARLDLIFAKARLAFAQRAHRPLLHERPRLSFPSARHPLLPSERVVPVNLRLGSDFGILVITGPNTGGKTVTLKTAGLLSLMVQSGLFVPAGADAEATVFDAILADIGDEQSIEQSLSTFSSHMSNIVRVLNHAGPRSLVLLDEIGAGTDPTEGAALATALLEELHERRCLAIATTHYGQLKEFAYTHEGVANASVTFDPETLAPTFRLNIGVPGPSNALAIARRLGLSPHIVARARSLVGEDQIRVEEMIQRLVAEREALESERSDVGRLRREAAAIKLEYEARAREQEARYEQALGRLRGELRTAVLQARSQFDSVIRDLRGLAELADRRELERGITELRERLRTVRREVEDQVGEGQSPSDLDPSREGLAASQVRPGLRVRLRRLGGQVGTVLAAPDASGQVPVQAGILRVTARVDELSLADEAEDGGPGVPATGARGSRVVDMATAKTVAFSPELDLRGLTVADALLRVDKYLDDAVLAGAHRVRLIHGKGTGALRDAVSQHLRSLRCVSSSAFAPPTEGGDGVTVAELR
jgi:DNA mismatch repair protein MutS2